VLIQNDPDTWTARYKDEVIASAPTTSELMVRIGEWFQTYERDTSIPIKISNKHGKPLVVGIPS
jgi:hypothetical protein